jgi:UDP-N-acetylglucosamine 2-epimerase (non-hydrolysing)
VRATVSRMLTMANCSVVPPLDYRDLVHVLSHASLVLTDSGGIQEEAPTFGVPVLVLREKTERPEGIDAGVAQLVGTDADVIVAAASAILSEDRTRARIVNPYGDGTAARRIVAILRSASGLQARPDVAAARPAGQPEQPTA